jgi:archaellum component FlaC
MHNRDKYPAIWVEKEKAEKELSVLMEKRKVHTDALKQIDNEMIGTKVQTDAEKVRLNNLAMIDYPRIKELTENIARCAIAMGAVVASRGR